MAEAWGRLDENPGRVDLLLTDVVALKPAVVVIAVVLVMIGVLLRPPRPATDDGPLPPDVEAQVLLGEDPDPPHSTPTADEDDPRR